MIKIKKSSDKAKVNNLQIRSWLLVLQIILPFGLYVAFQAHLNILMILISTIFILSMVFLVWLG